MSFIVGRLDGRIDPVKLETMEDVNSFLSGEPCDDVTSGRYYVDPVGDDDPEKEEEEWQAKLIREGRGC